LIYLGARESGSSSPGKGQAHAAKAPGFGVESKAKAFVVGHPRGSGLQISLHDSLLLDIDDDERLMHYRTPTDPGSSEIPVFNTDWEVIGVPHGSSSSTPRLQGAGEYETNEAIALGAVARKLLDAR
jgi:Trypsin-like peptidase domain